MQSRQKNTASLIFGTALGCFSSYWGFDAIRSFPDHTKRAPKTAPPRSPIFFAQSHVGAVTRVNKLYLSSCSR